MLTLSNAEQNVESTDTVRVAVIQGNIDQGIKWDEAFKQHILDIYLRLSAGTLDEQPDLIIWPETAAPFVFKYAPLYQDQLIQAVQQWQVPLLFGGVDVVFVPPPKKYYSLNSAFLLSHQGDLVAQYDKIHLVPFGEYVPFKKVLSFVDRLVTAIGEILPGQEYTVMPFRDTPFSCVICFEIIFPNLVRKFVDNGARFVVTITNDAWYGRSSAPYQHFAMATFRAVENRVAIARAANTGISGFIDPMGRILARSDIFVEDALVYDIPVRATTTFYSQYGDIFVVGCLLLTIVWTGKARYNSWRARNRQRNTSSNNS
jgi:apolipoprotein N-acyltransferase